MNIPNTPPWCCIQSREVQSVGQGLGELGVKAPW